MIRLISKFNMNPNRKVEEKIANEKLAVFTFDGVINEPGFRRYFIKNWKAMTVGMKSSTMLFMAGIHGTEYYLFVCIADKTPTHGFNSPFSYITSESDNFELTVNKFHGVAVTRRTMTLG